MILRRPEWRMLLDSFLTSRRDSAFVWGSNDCVMFAADAVLAMTGTDLARGKRIYQTAAGARRMILDLGGLTQIVTQCLGPCLPADKAEEGDVLLADTGAGRDGLAICMIGGMAVAPGENGLVWFRVDANRASCCWKV